MNNNFSPLISIITPCYNCSNFISETIESVISQTYLNWEMIIQDDCSNDNSVSIASYYAAKDKRIKVFVNKIRSGAAVTRNNAIIYSKGDYLAYLDSDDVWLPTKLEDQLKFMIDNSSDFSFTCYEHIDEESNRLGLKANVIKRLTYFKMLMHCWPGCLTVMYKQDVNNKIIGPDVKKNNDHALFLRVLKNSHNAMGFDKSLAYYRIRKNSISSRKLDIIKYYITVIYHYEKKNILFALFCVFTHVVIKKFIKYKKVCK